MSAALSALGNKILLVKDRPHIIISDDPEKLKELSKKYPKAWTAQFSQTLPNKKELLINIGPFVIAKHNKLCKGVYLKGSRWASPQNAFPVKELMPLISCKGNFLLSEKVSVRENGPRHFYFSFEPRHSNIQKTDAWPILIHNLTELRTESFPGFNKRNFRTGEQAKGNFFNSKEVKLTPVNGKVENSKKFNGGNFIFSSSVPIFLKISSDEKDEGKIAFNFLSPEESDLSSGATGNWSGEEKGKGIIKAAWRDEAWMFLLAALGFGVLHAFFARKLEARL
jgi:hypothetical protein